MLIDERDIRVRYLVDLPYSIKGFVVREDEGSYDIYLNPNHSYETQKKTLDHELEHIKFDDFSKHRNVNYLESE